MLYVTFLCPNKKVTKEIVIGEALSGWPAPAPEPPSPMYPTRPALTMPRSILTYILSIAKMFRFLLCRGRLEKFRKNSYLTCYGDGAGGFLRGSRVERELDLAP